MQVGSCIPVGIQLQKAEVGPTSGPTWRLSHFRRPVAAAGGRGAVDPEDRRRREHRVQYMYAHVVR
jgi:hypothetical protein